MAGKNSRKKLSGGLHERARPRIRRYRLARDLGQDTFLSQCLSPGPWLEKPDRMLGVGEGYPEMDWHPIQVGESRIQ